MGHGGLCGFRCLCECGQQQQRIPWIADHRPPLNGGKRWYLSCQQVDDVHPHGICALSFSQQENTLNSPFRNRAKVFKYVAERPLKRPHTVQISFMGGDSKRHEEGRPSYLWSFAVGYHAWSLRER